ncbi:hypothetical protein [Actinoplanes sp. HUAS TT8]|uniref:hypothetical protein n=1 Tax=Actinoplanes sp. HUAS TT8 TaxID=3447453 RepID=UPI003F51C2A3
MVRKPSANVQGALALLSLFWMVGAGFLLASWRSGVAEQRVRDAPVCSGDPFTSAPCRVTLDATMVALSSGSAQMTVGGRDVTAVVSLSGEIDDVRGRPVRVTLYRGKVIHVDGDRLNFDTDAAPATHHTNFRNFGLFFIVGPALMIAFTLVWESVKERRAAGR